MSDKPRFLQRRARQLTGADIARLTRDARSRRAALLAVDEAVARIVAALSRRGELDNTYIVFTSDNGYMQGEHRVRSGKMLPYEPSGQVPLLIRGPGLPAGRVSSELVANTDLAPTLLDIAGAERGQDGRRALAPPVRPPPRLAHAPSRSCTRPAAAGTRACASRTRPARRPLARAGDDLSRRPHPRLALRPLPQRRQGALRPAQRPHQMRSLHARLPLPADAPRARQGAAATRALRRASDAGGPRPRIPRPR